jgi:hypothetical protein
VPADRTLIAIFDVAFESPLARRRFLESEAFLAAYRAQAGQVAHASAFAVSGVYTYVRDGELTTAGLRGSRAAQLIERLGANNQIADDVRALIATGTVR